MAYSYLMTCLTPAKKTLLFPVENRKALLLRIRPGYSLVLMTGIVCLALLTSVVKADSSLPEARIVEINDGDTVVINMDGKRYRTRLIGIDAPEMGQDPWGRRAKEHLREVVKGSGHTVRVGTDLTKYDKYGRLLAYLWLDDRTLVNELMLRDGYAVLFTVQPNSKHMDRLKKAQHAAREDRLGIWGKDGLTERPIDYRNTHPRQ